jgi:hypothetical protein
MIDSSRRKSSAAISDAPDSTQSESSIGEAVESAMENVSKSASAASEQIQDEGASFLSRQKAVAADELGTLSKAVHQAADTLRSEQDAKLAEYAEFVADGLESVSNRLRGTNLNEVMQSCQDIARRRPELVYGGMFLAGLAMSRFLKISPNRSAE